MNCDTSMPSHQHSQPRPQAPSVGLSQSSSTKRMSCSAISMPIARERFEIELLQVLRRRLQDHLKLVIVLQPVRVLAIAPVLRPARGLHIGGVPGLRPERAQRGGGMEGAGADFHVIGLQDDAALLGPEILQRQDQPLERLRGSSEGSATGGMIGKVGKFEAADPKDASQPGQRGQCRPVIKPRHDEGLGERRERAGCGVQDQPRQERSGARDPFTPATSSGWASSPRGCTGRSATAAEAAPSAARMAGKSVGAMDHREPTAGREQREGSPIQAGAARRACLAVENMGAGARRVGRGAQRRRRRRTADW